MPFHPSQTSLAVAVSTTAHSGDPVQLDHAIGNNAAVVDISQNGGHRSTFRSSGDDLGLADDWELDEDLRRRQMVDYRAIVKSSPSRLEPLVARGEADGVDKNQLDRKPQQAARKANFDRPVNVMAMTVMTSQPSPVVPLGIPTVGRKAWVPIFFAGAGMLGGLCAMTTAQMWPRLLPIVMLVELGLAIMITLFHRQWAQIRPQP